MLTDSDIIKAWKNVLSENDVPCCQVPTKLVKATLELIKCKMDKISRMERRHCKNLDEIHNLKLDLANVEVEKKWGYQPYGYVEFVPDEALEDEAFSDELEDIKLFVLEKIIEAMRREAAENPDFFIIKRAKSGDPLTRNSVGLKICLPKRSDAE